MTTMKAAEVMQELDNVSSQIGITNDDDQYLTFMLADEEYGVDILRVQEIKGWDKVTKIPNTPDYMQGVINLRGAIVPIIDLRMRFKMEKLEYGPTTVVVVLRVQSEDRQCIVGIVVDAVSDVYNIPEDCIKSMPTHSNLDVKAAVSSIATVDEKMVILLDIDCLLNPEELQTIEDHS